MTTLLNLLAAIALLVWGTHIVRTGVLRVYGAALRQVLGRSMNGRAAAFFAGLGVTGLLQSSTATALLTSSFVSQGLLTTSAALAVMLGADVGTAVMVQLFSLDLSWLAPLAIVVGVVVYLSRRNERAGQIGRIVLGLGVMILALQLVTAATAPLAHGGGRQDAVRADLRRPAAGRAHRRRVRGDVLLEPGRGPAGGDAGRLERAAGACGAAAGARAPTSAAASWRC